VIELVESVNAEVERQLNAGTRKAEIADAATRKLDAAAWRKRFAGEDKDNGDAFDGSFAGLVKHSAEQIGVRQALLERRQRDSIRSLGPNRARYSRGDAPVCRLNRWRKNATSS
jgi:hypothetical protein